MLASIHNRVTGIVHIRLAFAEDGDGSGLLALVATWVRAVDLGFFGPGEIRVRTPLDAGAKVLSGSFEAHGVSESVFYSLYRAIRLHGKVLRADLRCEDGRRFSEAGALMPELPESLPFSMEYPRDAYKEVRIEIEFRAPLLPAELDGISAAFGVWDAMMGWLREDARPGVLAHSRTRLLSAAIVEHELFGYFASADCINLIAWLGRRLAERLPVERLTIES